MQRGHLLGKLVAEVGRIGHAAPWPAPSSLAAASGDGLAVGASHQNMHVLAKRPGRTHGLGDGGAQRLVVVFGEEKRRS